MGVHHPGARQSVGDLKRMIAQMVTASIQHAAIGRAGLRVYDGGWIRIENGGLDVTGTANITGRLDGSGTFDWTGPWLLKGPGTISGNTTGTGRLDWDGPWYLKGAGTISGNTTGTGSLLWSGPWEMRGNGDITGNVDITGALDVLNRLSLGPNGYIESGSVRIDRFGSYGGRVASTDGILLLDSASVVLIGAPTLTTNAIGATHVEAVSLEVGPGAKNFKMPHPTKACHVLRHGSTESPVSGVEYWDEETLPESGELVIELPDYFEALTKLENRAVFVTARGFIADWSDIDDGKFTVTGDPGGRFSWSVKAERKGADFLVEEATPFDQRPA